MKASRTLFMRHGSYEHGTGGLNEVGKEQAIGAAARLDDLGLGPTTLIHSSKHLRAVQTAEIIARVLNTSYTNDEIIAIAGERPDAVSDLNEVVETALKLQGLDSTGKDIVIVTHMPLVAFLEYGDPYEPVNNCHIHEYKGNWDNRYYRNGRDAVRLAELLHR
jgi:broad specificity phosphatase PhoE